MLARTLKRKYKKFSYSDALTMKNQTFCKSGIFGLKLLPATGVVFPCYFLKYGGSGFHYIVWCLFEPHLFLLLISDLTAVKYAECFLF